MRIIRTKPIRKDKKKQFADDRPLIFDKTCRVCKGTGEMPRKLGDHEYTTECTFCDESGHAKAACGDCGEVLPGCECVRMMGHCLPPEKADEHPR